jgi:drug/metabolite transporter (DMT)-like permease
MTVHERRPALAAGLMLLATASFVGMQAAVKSARLGGLHASEVMFLRTAPGLPVLWWALARRGQGLKPDRPANLFVRALFGGLAMAANFSAMRYLTLGQFSTLQLSQPVFVALIAPLLLKERVRAATWLALVCAGAGALWLLAPWQEETAVRPFAAALGVASALASAVAMIWVRKASESDPVERVVFHFAAWVSLAALVAGLSSGGLGRLADSVGPGQLALWTAGMAGFGTLGQVLLTHAYLHGEATRVSMVGYSSVLLSMLLDVVLFDVAPASPSLGGAGLMAVAALIILRRR